MENEKLLNIEIPRLRLNRNIYFKEKNMLLLIDAMKKTDKTFNCLINDIVKFTLENEEIKEIFSKNVKMD